jgi:hypothetical protein
MQLAQLLMHHMGIKLCFANYKMVSLSINGPEPFI